MIKNIIVIIAILVASIILFTSKNTSEIKGDISRRDILDYFPSLSFPPLTISGNELALSVESWTTFEKYLEFAKTHDLNGIRNLSHQISDTCNDPLREKECFALMDSVYSFASLFKQNDFNQLYEECNTAKISCEKDLQMCLSQSQVYKQQLQASP